MSEQPPSWNDLNAKRETPVADDKIAELCAAIFTSSSGKLLLIELRKKYFDAPLNPLSEHRALRVRVTQQQFVRELELACERGVAAAAKRKPT